MHKKPISKKKVFVAMSGGVDSSTAAALLKERGFEVIGTHIQMWSPNSNLGPDDPIYCQHDQDRRDALRVATSLNIPFQVWDLTKEYKKAVVDYMLREYATGRTPNPDIMCNKHIKFGIFLKKALAAGADFVATGHYVKSQKSKVKSQNDNSKLKIIYKLLQAEDKNKDQSYFLWTLTQKQLKCCLFPIGDYTKPEVRKMAKKFGLPTADKKDSQGICFIGEIDLREFLKKHILTRPGLVKSTNGKTIGKHEGLAFYTIGQRHGLEIGGGVPYYVTGKDFKKNILIVAGGPYDQKLFSKELIVKNVNWISGVAPKLPLKCRARIRYRQPLQKCILVSQERVIFTEPQKAITPGQSVVFYKAAEMLGGGVIVG